VNYQSVEFEEAGVRPIHRWHLLICRHRNEPIRLALMLPKVRPQALVQLPYVGGTIAIAFNKPGCNLRLTQKQVADVFLV